MKRTHLLSYALLFLLLILGYPKITHTENPDTADLGGDEPSTGISFGITNNGSDWYIDFPYAYSSNYCNCTNLVSQSIDLYVWDQFDNQLLHVVGQGGSGNPDYDLVIGPGKNLNLDYSINFSGSRSWHRNLDDPCSIFATCIGTGVDCGCDYTYTGTISGTATTAAIKNPTGFSAADGADDNSITLNWSKGTDIPDFTHKYRVYVDGSPNHIVQLNGDVRTWTHTGLQPGETHSYRLTTYYTSAWAGTHESGGVTDSGSTFSTNTQASDGEHANRTLVKWADLSDVADEVRIERSNVGSNDREELEILSGTARSYSDAEGIPGFTYTYYVTPLFEGTPFLTGQDNGYSKPNGSIKGTVKSKFGAGVSGVDIEVELLSSIPAGGASLPGGCVTTYCTTTDITGYYEIKGIYYYTDADFKIVPSKTGAVTHVFTPAESLRSLDENVQALTNIDFVDQTVFTVNGHVNYPASANGQACGVKGVEILVNGDNLGITDSGNLSYRMKGTIPLSLNSFIIQFWTVTWILLQLSR